jgi:hypothetical protein
MKSVHLSCLLLAACFAGCQIQKSMTEQRVVELPADNPDATLTTAEQIGKDLIASGLGADIQKQFPNLTPQQLKGVYLTWNVGNFSGKKSIFFLTGIKYTGTLPDAKAVADYCESRLKEAVAAHFAPTQPETESK